MRGLSEEQQRRLEEIRGHLRHGEYGQDRIGVAYGVGGARADVRWLLQEWAEDRKSLKNLLRMYYDLLCAVVNDAAEPEDNAPPVEDSPTYEALCELFRRYPREVVRAWRDKHLPGLAEAMSAGGAQEVWPIRPGLYRKIVAALRMAGLRDQMTGVRGQEQRTTEQNCQALTGGQDGPDAHADR